MRLDNEDIGMRVAYSLSFLREIEQEIVDEYLNEGKPIRIGQAEILRKESTKKDLEIEDVERILTPEPKSAKVKSFKIKSELMSEFFGGGENDEDIENVIVEALRAYFDK